MKIIIIGCGKVGRALTEQLVSENHNITVIDTNPKKDSDYYRGFRCNGNQRKRSRHHNSFGSRDCAG